MNSTSSPRYSLIIPTYNRAGFIKNTVDSVIAQSFTDFEVIVVDDGSTDGTEQVVSAINDPRVSYYKKVNGERGAARNYGIAKAKGEYVTFLDSDDQLYPNHFEEAEKLVNKHDHPCMFRLAYEYRSADGALLSKQFHGSNINIELTQGNIFSCIGVFVQRSVISEVNFSENRKLSGTEDWLLWLRLSARCHIYGSNTITSVMINHDSRSVLNYDEQEMLLRTQLLLQGLNDDAVFVDKMGKYLPRIEAHMLSYIALHLLLSGNKNKALGYLVKAGKLSIGELFTKRSLSILRRMAF
tara:strand:- start:289 stop:1179 length:891 start_codon:yes stop_codon:yes gene_type:complete